MHPGPGSFHPCNFKHKLDIKMRNDYQAAVSEYTRLISQDVVRTPGGDDDKPIYKNSFTSHLSNELTHNEKIVEGILTQIWPVGIVSK